MTIRDQVPARDVDVVPSDVAPSKISTAAPACAVPETVSVALRLQLYEVGALMVGAEGARTGVGVGVEVGEGVTVTAAVGEG